MTRTADPRRPIPIDVLSLAEALFVVNEERIEMTCDVIEALKSGIYRVALMAHTKSSLTPPERKMRRVRIGIVVGDKVRVELSPYDLSPGRIVYRARNA
jgi:translation initiation factor IF-1